MSRALLAGLFLAVSATQALAIDEVIRKSGVGSAKGSITEITTTNVTVKPKIGQAVTVPANDIDRVRWDGEPPKLNLARSAEQAGRLQEAMEAYTEIAKDPKAKDENIKRDIDFMMARTLGKMALSDPSKSDEAIQRLEAFNNANPDHFYFYEGRLVLGQVLMAAKEYPKAGLAFDAVKKAPWADFKMAANSAGAKLKLVQNDIAGALQDYESVIALKATTAAEKSRRYEAILGKATCLTQQKSYDEAVTALGLVIKEAPAENGQIQAEAYIRQGDCFQAKGQLKEAILAYLRVPVLFSKEKALYAESLYHLANLWGRVGKPERGDQARQDLEVKFPNSEWTKKLAAGAG